MFSRIELWVKIWLIQKQEGSSMNFRSIVVFVLAIAILSTAGCAEDKKTSDESSSSSNFLPRLGM